jgi:hypothetical protein
MMVPEANKANIVYTLKGVPAELGLGRLGSAFHFGLVQAEFRPVKECR